MLVIKINFLSQAETFQVTKRRNFLQSELSCQTAIFSDLTSQLKVLSAPKLSSQLLHNRQTKLVSVYKLLPSLTISQAIS